MNSFSVQHLHAREILDSRGRPTVWAECRLESGATAAVSVPSGASTGRAEACELRDGDPQRYRGLGCRRAAGNVNTAINDAVRGRRFATQADFDRVLAELDGTPNLSRLGANATLAASLAFARAGALQRGVPLYRHFADLADLPVRTLPRLTVNLFSGGKHAGEQAALQDVLLAPVAAASIDDGLAAVVAVYQSAAELILKKYGQRLLRADEGGLAPDFPNAEAMLADAVESIRAAGMKAGAEMALAVDVASSHFYRDGRYHLGKTPLESTAMIDQVADWVRRYPLVSVEDGLAEDDWAHWPALRARLAGHSLTLGDDFLCTQPARIARAIEAKAADALLLKVNQVGTLSGAAEAAARARAAGWKITVSARSGETEDDWLADLAVGWGADFIKVGSITQSERLAKYNRLLAIEAETGLPLVRLGG
ncbi:MAG: phosphopyruvate hydratase [Opitutaceae bacterium]|nr:phosphopyruvate hydratase [Opitutaceae bacterium]